MAEIREARPDDLAALVALEDECEGTDAWSSALIADGLAGNVPTVRYLISDDLAGYAVISCVDDIAELQRIGVRHSHRRSGLDC